MNIGAGFKFLFDPITGAVVQIDNNHHEIHEGDHFLHARYYTLGNAAVKNLVLEVGAKSAHFVFSVASDTAGFILVSYKNVTYDAGSGTAVAVFNNNQNVTTANTLIIREDPTTLSTSGATLFRNAFIGTATNPANSRAGSLSRDDEIILPPNSKWLIRITNQSTNNNPINVNCAWYEK